jgi:hypothetical protein
MDIIKVIPIPNKNFISNSINVTEEIKDNNFDFTHTGEYNVKASSYTDIHPPYNAFNKLTNKYWQCGTKNKSFFSPYGCGQITYSFNPYRNSIIDNSAYQGGNPKIVTDVGFRNKTDKKNKIYGEWIQIKIPKTEKLYLHSYSILTPIPIKEKSQKIFTFPTKFMVVGSNDDDDNNNEQNWEYIDLKYITTYKDTTLQRPIKFNVNSSYSYSYYRLIIMEMPPKNSVVRINQWALNFSPYLSMNKDAFTNMNYAKFNRSNPLEKDNNSFTPLRISNIQRCNETEYIDNTNYNNVLPIFFTSILAISILFYYKKLLK